jgi:hypothetical protein
VEGTKDAVDVVEGGAEVGTDGGGDMRRCSYIAVLYHPPTFHMESMWNEYIPWIPHGFHMEYVSPYKSSSYYCGFHMDSMSIPCGMSPHGIHVEHT